MFNKFKVKETINLKITTKDLIDIMINNPNYKVHNRRYSQNNKKWFKIRYPYKMIISTKKQNNMNKSNLFKKNIIKGMKWRRNKRPNMNMMQVMQIPLMFQMRRWSQLMR
jgi:hypothetical protein